jgi:hypothetical protein
MCEGGLEVDVFREKERDEDALDQVTSRFVSSPFLDFS